MKEPQRAEIFVEQAVVPGVIIRNGQAVKISARVVGEGLLEVEREDWFHLAQAKCEERSVPFDFIHIPNLLFPDMNFVYLGEREYVERPNKKYHLFWVTKKSKCVCKKSGSTTVSDESDGEQ